MDDTKCIEIRNIKSKIIAMLQERHSLENEPSENNQTSVLDPSKYWSDFCSFFDYMLGLSEESFAKLRLHTYHLTGDNYQIYYFGDPEIFLVTSNLEAITKGLPPHFIINEPEGGIGFHYADGRFLSLDILRYQQVLSSFYRYKVLPELAVDNKRRHILEIGGGYGGLAHHLSNIYQNITYVIVDLPETLLFSASYLSLLNPEKKIYIYDKNGFQEFLRADIWDSYDFVLLPNYVLDSLTHLNFDLVINQASFQEMRIRQVELYLDFIRDTCKGVLYSWNQDHQPRNKELANLSDLLKQRFDLVEIVPDWQHDQEKPEIPLPNTQSEHALKHALGKLKSMAMNIRLLKRPEKPNLKMPELPYREYICKPLIHVD